MKRPRLGPVFPGLPYARVPIFRRTPADRGLVDVLVIAIIPARERMRAHARERGPKRRRIYEATVGSHPREVRRWPLSGPGPGSFVSRLIMQPSVRD